MVTLGAHNIKKKEDTWQKLEVVQQFPHPKYNDSIVRHDIMLLKVEILLPLLHFLFSRASPSGPIALTFPQPASTPQLSPWKWL